MDKTFNDLMDIVNRTKKIDGNTRPKPRPMPRPQEEEYSPREYDVVEEKPKRTRTVKKDSPNLLAGTQLEKLLEKKPTKTTTKKSTTTKSSTKKTSTKTATKSATKETTPKKISTPKVSKPKLTKDDVLSEIEVKVDKPKKTPIPTPSQPVGANDPKNAQLYEALKNSLFSGGTDISEYMELQEDSEARASLQELKAKREAHKINEEITKEQQEYEQLFNGSFESELQNPQAENFEDDEEEVYESVNVEEKNAQLASELNAIRNNLAQKKNNQSSVTQVNTTQNKKDETYELETGNRDLDRKIAEYYKRKQEKINEYKAREEEGLVEETREESEGPVDYEAIFGGSMMSRDELLGIKREEPEEETSQDTTENEDESVDEEVDITQDEVENINNEEETQNIVEEDKEEEETEEVLETEELPEGLQEETLGTITVDTPQEEEEIAEPINTESAFSKLSEQFEDGEELAQEPTVVIEPSVDEEDGDVYEEAVEESSAPTVEESKEIEEATEDNKETHIKSLLSDLLFSKKIYPNSNEDDNAQTVETQEVQNIEEDNSQEGKVEEADNRANYESIWNETLMGDNTPSETISSEVESEGLETIEPAFEEQEIQEEIREPQEEQEELSEEELLDSLSLNLGGENTSFPTPENEDVEQETTVESVQEETQGEIQEEPLAREFALIEDDKAVDNSQEEILENISEVDESNINIERKNQSDIVSGGEEFSNQTYSPINQSFEDEEVLGVEQEETTNDDMYDLSSKDADLSDYVLTGNIPDDENIVVEEHVEEPVYTEIEDVEEKFDTVKNVHAEDISSAEDNEDNDDAEDDGLENHEEAHIGYDELKDVEQLQEDGSPNEEVSETDGNTYDEHFESVVNNERIYEAMQPSNAYMVDEDPEDNTCVVETLPENRYDLFGNAIETEDEEKEEPVIEEKKDDVISKEEFYNEMARLQENLINQLKGNATTTESRDFFAEKDPEKERVTTEQANKLVDDMIEEFNGDNNIETEEEVETLETEKPQEESVVNEETSVCKAEPVDPEHYDDYNLLGKEEPLNDEDLEFQEKSEEEKVAEKDAYFYLSPEDNEKKAQEVDEYVQLFNEDNVQKEVGDIHIFKTIGNASPSSEILKDLTNDNVDSKEEKEEDKDEEVEAIYTLMGIERKPVAKVQQDMKVLYVASECQPFVASGGLGDVAGSLPKAIAKKGGVDIRVILPLYSSIKSQYRDKFEYLGNFTVHLSWRQEYCGLFRYYKDGVTYYFVDNERYFKRDKLYGYYDDGERFAYFSKAVVEALPYLNFFPDIIHCNDWQSSLVSAYIKTGNWSDFRYYKIKNIYTIHNVEYQGVYGMENLKDLFGIDNRFRNDMEYNGDINLTKAAIQYSDRFTTVSNSYCDNLKQPYCSRGLHHIIIRNEYKLSGIVNGIDYDFYNPATDTNLFKNFDFGCIEDKMLNKKSWQDEMGLPVDGNTPMIAIVSRLVNHKGIDLIMKVMDEILDSDVQLVVVGTGEEKYVNYFKSLESKYPTKVRAFVDEYSNENARKAYASSDIFLMPSKIEPCGISQMIASRYGCVPIVREVGGLRDTIKDFGCEGGGNGYTFTNYNPNDLKYQLNRAIRDYDNKSGWREKMKICMSTDFTWNRPADEYIKLYKSLYETM